MIGDGVEAIIIDVGGNKVRLGITAPQYVSVHRKEMYEVVSKETSSNKNTW